MASLCSIGVGHVFKLKALFQQLFLSGFGGVFTLLKKRFQNSPVFAKRVINVPYKIIF